MAQIVLDQIDKFYAGGVKAIDGLSLEVKDGEFMVLVGPSGCGKSTALRSIAGLEEISSGTITIGDRVVNDLPPKDRDIAMVFQNYALYPHLTVEQNLAFGLQLRKTPKDEIKRRVTEAARMLGLDQYLKRKPAALSGGQRQRVAMGRAIVREPQAFLMDEPLSNLDAKLRVSMRASLNQLHERLGVTTIYVTHDQVEAMTLGHRVCVMRDGRAAAGRHAAAPVRVAGQPLRGRLHRLAGDELRHGRADPGRRPRGHLRRVQARGARRGHREQAGPRQLLRRQIILGIRPSDFEDASLADTGWARMPVTAGVTEELGSEIHVIFMIDAPPVEHSSITDAATGDSGEDESVAALVGGRSLWTARVSARSKVRSSQPIELAIDTANLQFFDADSGLSIGHPEARLAATEPAGV